MTNINTMQAIAATNNPTPRRGWVNDCKSIIYNNLSKTITKSTRRETFLLAVLLAIATAAQAQTAFGGGSGTEPDPYLIYTTDHLDQLAADVNNGNMYENTYFKLMVNLSYTGKTYTPIGCVFFDGTQVVERRFCGVFLGQQPLHQQRDHQQPR